MINKKAANEKRALRKGKLSFRKKCLCNKGDVYVCSISHKYCRKHYKKHNCAQDYRRPDKRFAYVLHLAALCVWLCSSRGSICRHTVIAAAAAVFGRFVVKHPERVVVGDLRVCIVVELLLLNIPVDEFIAVIIFVWEHILTAFVCFVLL